ncbi:MAG: TIGR03067 domain-containing protein [Opitutales bacterium]|nr:TIGR03067 domain-containing protein [Opitutales bacterium]
MESPAPPALAGTWQIVKAELAGEEMPAFVARKIEVEFAADTYTVRFAGEVSDHGTYTLAPAGRHAGLLLAGLTGSNAGRSIPALYQLAGDRLRVCYGLDGVRPGGFATGPGQNLYLATYRRKVS